MARKNRTPEENARREKIRELLQMANIGSMEDIQSLFKETIAEFMENGLEAELDDELGYSKYDYKNKDTGDRRFRFYFVVMYYFHPRRLAKSSIAAQNLSHGANVISNGSPSRMRMVRRISLGMTTRPRSSIRRTIPVAFIYADSPLTSFYWP